MAVTGDRGIQSRMKKKVFILEDDINLVEALSKDFKTHNYDVVSANSMEEWISLSESLSSKSSKFDYAVIDIRLKQGTLGINGIARILELYPDCRIIILTGYGSVVTAVEALKRGAVDYLMKPASFKQIEAALLGTASVSLSSAELFTPTLSQVEHEHIDYVLTKNGGNISRAAKDLGLHRQSLQRKLKKYT